MNPNKKYYGDSRLNHFCAYCGNLAETEDHVPSRCFLDEPYPQDMPVVPCCHKCNHDFSEDEEYVSCIIDCMKADEVIPNRIQRVKTRKTLLHSPKLQERIASQKRDFGGLTFYDFEKDRFEKVIRKLPLAIWLLRTTHYHGIAHTRFLCGCYRKCPMLRKLCFFSHSTDLCCQKFVAMH